MKYGRSMLPNYPGTSDVVGQVAAALEVEAKEKADKCAGGKAEHAGPTGKSSIQYVITKAERAEHVLSVEVLEEETTCLMSPERAAAEQPE
ncbi:hypothetical protein SRHO_G00156320 [Serrasalmus rhombeus]